MNHEQQLLRRIRALTLLVIAGLVISGATAIPVETEVNLLASMLGHSGPEGAQPAGVLAEWILRAQTGVHAMNAKYPFIAYGGDWLAFGHFAIAIVFIGAWRDPVRNAWLFDFGLIVSALVLPYALCFGAWRGIPVWWRLIDCSFGVGCVIPLWICRRYVMELARLTIAAETSTKGRR